jgi:hypothetical protein
MSKLSVFICFSFLLSYRRFCFYFVEISLSIFRSSHIILRVLLSSRTSSVHVYNSKNSICENFFKHVSVLLYLSNLSYICSLERNVIEVRFMGHNKPEMYYKSSLKLKYFSQVGTRRWPEMNSSRRASEMRKP